MKKTITILALGIAMQTQLYSSESMVSHNKFLKKTSSEFIVETPIKEEIATQNTISNAPIQEIIIDNKESNNTNSNTNSNTNASFNKYEKNTSSSATDSNLSNIDKTIMHLKEAKNSLSTIDIPTLDKDFALKDIQEIIDVLEKR